MHLQVLNSRRPYDIKDARKGFDLAFGVQMEALNQLYQLMDGMTQVGDKPGSHLPCQKGFLLTINGVKGLYNELIRDGYDAYKLEYILTARLTQVILEYIHIVPVRGIERFSTSRGTIRLLTSTERRTVANNE